MRKRRILGTHLPLGDEGPLRDRGPGSPSQGEGRSGTAQTRALVSTSRAVSLGTIYLQEMRLSVTSLNKPPPPTRELPPEDPASLRDELGTTEPNYSCRERQIFTARAHLNLNPKDLQITSSSPPSQLLCKLSYSTHWRLKAPDPIRMLKLSTSQLGVRLEALQEKQNTNCLVRAPGADMMP